MLVPRIDLINFDGAGDVMLAGFVDELVDAVEEVVHHGCQTGRVVIESTPQGRCVSAKSLSVHRSPLVGLTTATDPVPASGWPGSVPGTMRIRVPATACPSIVSARLYRSWMGSVGAIGLPRR